MYRGEFDLALRLDEDLLHLSLQRNDSGGMTLGHGSCGFNLVFAGRFLSYRLHFEEALALYDPTSHRSLVHQVGYHSHVIAQSFLGIVLFGLGFPSQALTLSNEAVAEARNLAHLPTLAASLSLGNLLLSLDGDSAVLDERIEQLVAVATEQDFPQWRAQATIYRGWVDIRGAGRSDRTRAIGDNENVELKTRRHTVDLVPHRAGVPIDIDGSQLSARFVLGVSQPISHSRSFDQRRRVREPLTAIADALRCPTRTIKRLPRVTAV
jgi:hypothetical protein